jgi:hypothetical protein
VIGIQDWMCDVLMSRGALVESGDDGRIGAMLPAEIATALGANEWLSLDFPPSPGADDVFEGMERMERVLPAQPLIVSASIQKPAPSVSVDAASVLEATSPSKMASTG